MSWVSKVVWYLWFGLLKFLAWVALDTQLYYEWSKLGRRIYQSEYTDKKLRVYENEQAIIDHAYRGSWYADPWWQFFDMISAPAWTEAQLTKTGRDCEDTGYFMAQAFRELCDRQKGKLFGKFVRSFHLLTIPYLTGWKPGGHSVGVLEYMVETKDGPRWAYAWYSNWNRCEPIFTSWNGEYLWTIEDVVRDVCGWVGGGTKNTRWALAGLPVERCFKTGGTVT